jgi:hypothetical protein
MTDEDAVILVIEPLQSGAQHRGDDGAFVLGWHEDRDEAGGFRLRGKVGGEAARIAIVDRQQRQRRRPK